MMAACRVRSTEFPVEPLDANAKPDQKKQAIPAFTKVERRKKVFFWLSR